MDASPERDLGLTMRSQHGHVTREQLEESGVSGRTIRRRELRGELIRTGRHTWRSPAVPISPIGLVYGACLDLRAVASHWTAAWLHGLVPTLVTIDLLMVRSRSLWVPPAMTQACGPHLIRLHTTTDLPQSDVTEVGGVKATSLARTLLILGALVPAELSQERLTELVETACTDHAASERWLVWLLEQRRVSGRDGVIAFEEALASRLRLGPTESWLERTFIRLVVDAGLPAPIVQKRVERRGRFVGRVDFTFAGTNVIVEVLGYEHHRSKADLERDTRRANALQLAGFRVLQYSYEQVVHDPGSVLADLAAALGIDLTPAA